VPFTLWGTTFTLGVNPHHSQLSTHPWAPWFTKTVRSEVSEDQEHRRVAGEQIIFKEGFEEGREEVPYEEATRHLHRRDARTRCREKNPPECVQRNLECLRGHLTKYRESNLARVSRLEFNPKGVSPETGAIAKALGSCVVDSPALQESLVSILALRDRQRISERLDTAEAFVVEAVLALSKGGAEQLYAREIAVEVNRLLEARGERSKLSPEKVGHRLDLPARRLSQAGNGLLMDKEKMTRLKTLSGMYVGEDLLADSKNLHCWQAIEKNDVEEVL
jgi:hypothetical protein